MNEPKKMIILLLFGIVLAFSTIIFGNKFNFNPENNYKSSEFNNNEIKFKIFETIREKGFYIKLDKNKLTFYEKPADNTKVDYLK